MQTHKEAFSSYCGQLKEQETASLGILYLDCTHSLAELKSEFRRHQSQNNPDYFVIDFKLAPLVLPEFPSMVVPRALNLCN